MFDAIERMLSGFRTRLALMARRAIIAAVRDPNPVQVVDLRLYAGEERTGIERIQEYGFSSVPLEGAQAIALFVDGECAHGIVLATEDRRYRPTAQDDGDVTIYTYRDADAAHHIRLTAKDRTVHVRGENVTIVVDGAVSVKCQTAAVEAVDTITLKAGQEVVADTPAFRCTGDIFDNRNGDGNSMAKMRDTFNAHKHTCKGEGKLTTEPDRTI